MLLSGSGNVSRKFCGQSSLEALGQHNYRVNFERFFGIRFGRSILTPLCCTLLGS